MCYYLGMQYTRTCTIDEAADQLGVDRSTVSRWLSAGKLTVASREPITRPLVRIDTDSVIALKAIRDARRATS